MQSGYNSNSRPLIMTNLWPALLSLIILHVLVVVWMQVILALLFCFVFCFQIIFLNRYPSILLLNVILKSAVTYIMGLRNAQMSQSTFANETGPLIFHLANPQITRNLVRIDFSNRLGRSHYLENKINTCRPTIINHLEELVFFRVAQNWYILLREF